MLLFPVVLFCPKYFSDSVFLMVPIMSALVTKRCTFTFGFKYILSVFQQVLDIKVGTNELQLVMSLPGRGSIHVPGYVPRKCQVFKA